MAVLDTVMEHYMFNGLDDAQRRAVIDQWRLATPSAGEQLIQQGEIGDTVYGGLVEWSWVRCACLSNLHRPCGCATVVESGTVEVHVDGEKVFETSKSGFLFGEMALLYDGRFSARLWAARALALTSFVGTQLPATRACLCPQTRVCGHSMPWCSSALSLPPCASV